MQQQKLSVLEKVGYSLGDLAANLIFQTLMTFLAYFYTDVYKIPAGKAGLIIFTGGIAYSPTLVPDLKAKVEWIAPVTVYPGEDELLALAQGAIRVLDGEEEAKIY